MKDARRLFFTMTSVSGRHRGGGGGIAAFLESANDFVSTQTTTKSATDLVPIMQKRPRVLSVVCAVSKHCDA